MNWRDTRIFNVYRKGMNHFFFLAAGFGKRMGPWTETRPKPLLEIDNISFLDYALFLAYTWGVTKAWINVHYLAEQIKDHLQNFHGFPLVIVEEKEKILGTAGGLATAFKMENTAMILTIFNPDTLLFPNSNFALRESIPLNSKIHLYLSKLKPSDHYTKIHLNFDSSISFGEGEFYYIGLCLLNLQILKEIPINSYADLSDIFKEYAIKKQITGEVFEGNSLDLGEQKIYEDHFSRDIFGSKKPLILDFISYFRCSKI